MRSKNQCSMCPAIHTKSRSWLRSSSTREPSDPLLRVVIQVFLFRAIRPAFDKVLRSRTGFTFAERSSESDGPDGPSSRGPALRSGERPGPPCFRGGTTERPSSLGLASRRNPLSRRPQTAGISHPAARETLRKRVRVIFSPSPATEACEGRERPPHRRPPPE